MWSERSDSDNNNQSTDLNHYASSPKFEFHESYYCNDNFQTNDVTEYLHHEVIKHPKKLLYPSKADLERHRLDLACKRRGVKYNDNMTVLLDFLDFAEIKNSYIPS
jgi:hypothetical protein